MLICTCLLLPCAELQQLTVEAPDSTLSSRISTQPVWLWLHPNAWANKLTCLQLRGVPLLSGTLAIQGLTQLQRLCLTGTQLRPSTVEHLLRQLSSCEQLTALVLSGNDMCLLPEQGWEGVTGLKVRGAADLWQQGHVQAHAAMREHLVAGFVCKFHVICYNCAAMT